MDELSLVVWRNETPSSDDIEGQKLLHRERARLLHNLADLLDLPVKSWGNTFTEKPHEWVEIIVALGSAGVFTTLVGALKIWLERKKVTDIVLKGSGGGTISLKGATASDVESIAKAVGFNLKG